MLCLKMKLTINESLDENNIGWKFLLYTMVRIVIVSSQESRCLQLNVKMCVIMWTYAECTIWMEMRGLDK